MKTTILLAIILGGSVSLSVAESKLDCRPISLALYNAVKGKEVADVMKLIEKEFTANPECSCELIRSAIMGYKPRPQVVGSMVDKAISAAPDYIEVIIMCALAAAPDAEAEILTVANKFGFTPNPLDVPGLVGEGPDGQLIDVPIIPVIVNPPPEEVTPVNP